MASQQFYLYVAMRLKGLDLNLLVALDILLDERNVSNSAKRLHVSQPAASAALARLRDFFGDELLVQHGIRMIPTSFAQSIHKSVKDILKSSSDLIATSTEFDPKASTRSFTIMASDYITHVLLRPLLIAFEQSAPDISFDIRLPDQNVRQNFERGSIDLVLAPESHLSIQHPAELVFDEPHVIIGWEKNPLLNREISAEEFYHAKHVCVRVGAARYLTYTEHQLELRGVKRERAINLQSFTVLPGMLVGTHRIAVVQERLAQSFASVLPLKTAKLPFNLDPMRVMAQYHAAKSDDQGLQWLIKQITQLAATFESNHTDPHWRSHKHGGFPIPEHLLLPGD